MRSWLRRRSTCLNTCQTTGQMDTQYDRATIGCATSSGVQICLEIATVVCLNDSSIRMVLMVTASQQALPNQMIRIPLVFGHLHNCIADRASPTILPRVSNGYPGHFRPFRGRSRSEISPPAFQFRQLIPVRQRQDLTEKVIACRSPNKCLLCAQFRNHLSDLVP
jgi:hypothetical protein